MESAIQSLVSIWDGMRSKVTQDRKEKNLGKIILKSRLNAAMRKRMSAFSGCCFDKASVGPPSCNGMSLANP